MRIKHQYILFIGILHVVLTILVYHILEEQKLLFILSELLILVSLYFSLLLYQSFIRPIDLMKSGIYTIRAEDFNTRFLHTKSNEINELINTFNVMLGRLRSERINTEEQALLLENIIASTPIGMIIMGFDGEITNINAAACHYLKIPQNEQPQNWYNISHPLSQKLEKLDPGKSQIIQLQGQFKYKCQAQNVIHRGFNRKFVMIEELSRDFLQNEKMAYGKVIRMMAHEVNNSIGAINSILQSVIDFGFDQDANKGTYTDSLHTAITRNDDLADFMKNFAKVIRLPKPVLKAENLVEIAAQTVQYMSPLAKNHDIEIKINGHEDQILLMLDTILIKQALVNMIKNSIESIESQGAITLFLSTRTPQLVVVDNGAGISREAQENLFSPFFSTKPYGQGVGLTLIRDILYGHQATFHLESNHDEGLTSFSVSFPLIEQ